MSLMSAGEGRCWGSCLQRTFLHEPQLIGFGYDLEQELNVRQQSQFLGSVIPVPNADLLLFGAWPEFVFTTAALNESSLARNILADL